MPTDRPTLAALLFEHPFAANEIVVSTIDRSVSLGALQANARERARLLRDEYGIQPGSAVAVALPNGPELLAAMFAVWAVGATFIALNPRAPRHEREASLERTRPAVVIDADGSHSRVDPEQYPTDIAFVLWTSGTTGTPRPIWHTHTAYLELIDRVLAPLRGSETERAARSKPPTPSLIPVSMALNAGIYNTLFGLRAGAALVIMEGFSPESFATLVARHEVRSTVLPPAAIAALNDANLPSLAPLRYVRSITAPLSPLQARRFTEKYGAFVLNSYGQAEIGEVIGWTAADAREHPDKVGAAGRPHAGVSIRLSETGELLVKAPSNAVGIDERFDADGYIGTGDLAHIDDDGFVWIDGRIGDVINRGGNKVFPVAVEEVLLLHASIDDCAVAAEPDDRLGEVPVAFLVGRPVPDAELVALCREHLVPYKVPVAFHWVDAIPRNEIGKALRREVGRAPRVGD